jgi:hypothetical protein
MLREIANGAQNFLWHELQVEPLSSTRWLHVPVPGNIFTRLRRSICDPPESDRAFSGQNDHVDARFRGQLFAARLTVAISATNYGRGTGVGRDLGDGVALAAGVAVGVVVDVGVAVGIAVGVGVAAGQASDTVIV